MFTLKDIDGAVVEKRKIIPWTMGYKKDADYFNLKNGLYNDGIDSQSSVRLELDREGLAIVLFRLDHTMHWLWEEAPSSIKIIYYNRADAIRNAPINQILKVVKG